MPIRNNTSATVCPAKSITLGINGNSSISPPNVHGGNFLTIAPALPVLPGVPVPPKLSKRSYNSFSSTGDPFDVNYAQNSSCDVTLQWTREENTIVASRTPAEREKNPDRLCLDRRGLTTFPEIIGEPKLRLMSLQHNLLTKIDDSNFAQLKKLVFLDLYDNQIERISSIDSLENLRVLLIGKNRIKRIEGLNHLAKLEVLDLHGNQILQISGLDNLACLKVLNLAGNNIKVIGSNDFHGLTSLRELNLKRNKIKKLLGFGETPQLHKLYISNNDIQKIEDMGSLAKALQIKEITIDGNPVTLNTDYVSFLVSYLPNLQLLSTMQINEHIRRTAMAWRTVKEQSNSAFLNLTTQVCLNIRREEVISNAKTNWEYLREQNKSHTDKENKQSTLKPGNMSDSHAPNSHNFNGVEFKGLNSKKSRNFGSLTSINENVEAKQILIKNRSNSSDNLLQTSNTSKMYPLEFKLPPILGSIVDNLRNNKISECLSKPDSTQELTINNINSDSDSSSSSESYKGVKGDFRSHLFRSNNQTSMQSDKHIFQKYGIKHSSLMLETTESEEYDCKRRLNSETPITIKSNHMTTSKEEKHEKGLTNREFVHIINSLDNSEKKSTANSFVYSVNTKESKMEISNAFSADDDTTNKSVDQSINKDKLRTKSAQSKKLVYYKSNRAATARTKYRTLTLPNPTPQESLSKEREQGGDYLIEIAGRCLNVYGQGALRFIERCWDTSKSHDVNTVKFNYVQFNHIVGILSKLKHRFPNAEHFVFKETNISYLGQINALAEIQGLTSIHLEAEGNPIVSKDWRVYAVFRLVHWGLHVINGKEITDEEIEFANQEYSGLIDIVMSSLPESLLQPLLQRLHLEKVQKQNGEQITAKQFLFKCDPALKNVVAKEALQWRKGNVTQEDLIWRHKGKMHLLNLINLTVDAIHKLQMLDKKWPDILYELIYNTLSDFSEVHTYMKSCSKMLECDK